MSMGLNERLGFRGLERWGRPLAIVTAVVFFISSAFPVAVGLTKNTGAIPKLWGILDVCIAFVLTILDFAIVALAESKVPGRLGTHLSSLPDPDPVASKKSTQLRIRGVREAVQHRFAACYIQLWDVTLRRKIEKLILFPHKM